MYSLSFQKLTYPYNITTKITFPSAQKVLFCPFDANPHPPSTGLICIAKRLVLPVLRLHLNGSVQDVLSYFFFGIMPVRFIHVAVCVSTSFFFVAE